MQNTLGLDDDLDPIELQEALEVAFGIRFGATEAAACFTVGDILHVLHTRLAPPQEGATGCATAMAFYHLRRALGHSGTGGPPRPASDLALLSPTSPRRLLADLSRHSGLRLPRWQSSLVGQIGGWMIVAGLAWLLLTAVIAPSLWFTAVATMAAGSGLACIDPGRLPADCRTLGELARKAAGLNFGGLAAEGAKIRDKDLWNALVEVLSEHSLLPKAEIHPGTLILYKP